jgi:(p)ppGpp synthase/HD superfamily hydrolase
MFLVARGHDDEELVAAAYLHDTIEDTETTFEEIQKEFGLEVANIVQELTFKRSGNETHREKATRMANELATASKKARLVKLADRLHNLKTIGEFPIWKQKRYYTETLYLLEKIGDTDLGLRREIQREVTEGLATKQRH